MSDPSIPPPLQPMPYAVPAAPNNDLSHLKLLAIFHWIGGGLTMLVSCVFIVHIVMGILMLNGAFPMAPRGAPGATTAPATANELPPVWFGWMFICMGSLAMSIGWLMGSLTIFSGFCIKRRRRRMFSIVIAGISCIHFPLGTTLGVFTIIVLIRDSVKALYETEAQTHGRSA